MVLNQYLYLDTLNWNLRLFGIKNHDSLSGFETTENYCMKPQQK